MMGCLKSVVISHAFQTYSAFSYLNAVAFLLALAKENEFGSCAGVVVKNRLSN